KLSTINLYTGASIAEQRLRHSFHDAGLAGTGRPQKQQITHWASRRIESSHEHLEDLHDIFDGLVLTDNSPVQGIGKFSCVFTTTRRVELGGKIISHTTTSPSQGYAFRPPKIGCEPRVADIWQSSCHGPLAG